MNGKWSKRKRTRSRLESGFLHIRKNRVHHKPTIFSCLPYQKKKKPIFSCFCLFLYVFAAALGGNVIGNPSHTYGRSLERAGRGVCACVFVMGTGQGFVYCFLGWWKEKKDKPHFRFPGPCFSPFSLSLFPISIIPLFELSVFFFFWLEFSLLSLLERRP